MSLAVGVGVGYVAISGIDAAVSHWLENGANTMIANAPASWIQLAVFMQLPWCLSFIMGGCAVRLLLSGLSSGTRLGRLNK